MGLRIRRQKVMPIGVDLGSSRLKMAQVSMAGSQIQLLAAQATETPLYSSPETKPSLTALAENISAMLRSGSFRGREAVLSLPAAATFVQPVKVRPGTPEDMDQAVRNELQGKLPYPVGDAVIRHQLAGTVYADGGQMQERIVVATARRDLDGYLDAAKCGGLAVVGISVEACAIVACFARLFRRTSDKDRMTLFIDLGLASTQVVLARGPEMVFARNMSLGGRMLDEEVAKALSISPEQAHGIRMKT
ncbi:hypothetical protein LCGC14_2544130, partial [marine sediment metagenome]